MTSAEEAQASAVDRDPLMRPQDNCSNVYAVSLTCISNNICARTAAAAAAAVAALLGLSIIHSAPAIVYLLPTDRLAVGRTQSATRLQLVMLLLLRDQLSSSSVLLSTSTLSYTVNCAKFYRTCDTCISHFDFLVFAFAIALKYCI